MPGNSLVPANAVNGQPVIHPGKRPKTGGRTKGVPNKTTALLKDAILRAAENAGGPEGLIGYLEIQAKLNPGPFMALLGKVLPMQLTGNGNDNIKIVISGIDADLL
jgi:hypothetical protein